MSEFQIIIHRAGTLSTQNARQRLSGLAIAFVAFYALVGDLTGCRKSTAPATSTQPALREIKPPTLGFIRTKDVSPISDDDAIHEEWKLEKDLPGNEFVHDKRNFHEMALMNEFIEDFKNSEECSGITLYLKADKKPDFTLRVNVTGHDDPNQKEQTWTWILGYPKDRSPADSKSHGMGGIGIQSNGKLTARDVCLTIWDDLDPNHFKKPGGRIE